MKFYNCVAGFLKIVFRIIFKVEVRGIENIPKDGGVLFVSNHKSNFDPPFIASFLPAQLTFMAKEELFQKKLLGALLRKCGAFPIRRGGGDISAMKAALRLLREGRNMLIFPEGTRCTVKGKLLKGKSGAALLAYKSDAKIIPLGINGEYKFRGKIELKIGEPLKIGSVLPEKPSSSDLQNYTDNHIMENIKLLAGAEGYAN